MSDKMRWRYGDTNPVVPAVESETVIEIGSLVWLDCHHAKPASRFPVVDMAEARVLFAQNFLGVAMRRNVAGDTTPIRVATTGVFEFECDRGQFELGDLVGTVSDGGGNNLCDHHVAPVTDSACAIARVCQREAYETGTVLVDIRSTVMTGGIR